MVLNCCAVSAAILSPGILGSSIYKNVIVARLSSTFHAFLSHWTAGAVYGKCYVSHVGWMKISLIPNLPEQRIQLQFNICREKVIKNPYWQQSATAETHFKLPDSLRSAKTIVYTSSGRPRIPGPDKC